MYISDEAGAVGDLGNEWNSSAAGSQYSVRGLGLRLAQVAVCLSRAWPSPDRTCSRNTELRHATARGGTASCTPAARRRHAGLTRLLVRPHAQLRARVVLISRPARSPGVHGFGSTALVAAAAATGGAAGAATAATATAAVADAHADGAVVSTAVAAGAGHRPPQPLFNLPRPPPVSWPPTLAHRPPRSPPPGRRPTAKTAARPPPRTILPSFPSHLPSLLLRSLSSWSGHGYHRAVRLKGGSRVCRVSHGPHLPQRRRRSRRVGCVVAGGWLVSSGLEAG